MSAELLQALGLASAGITVAMTAAALIVIRLVVRSEMSRETANEVAIVRRRR